MYEAFFFLPFLFFSSSPSLPSSLMSGGCRLSWPLRSRETSIFRQIPRVGRSSSFIVGIAASRAFAFPPFPPPFLFLPTVALHGFWPHAGATTDRQEQTRKRTGQTLSSPPFLFPPSLFLPTHLSRAHLEAFGVDGSADRQGLAHRQPGFVRLESTRSRFFFFFMPPPFLLPRFFLCAQPAF